MIITLQSVNLDVLHGRLSLLDLLGSLGLEVRIIITFLKRRKG